ncbi:EAL domain-containing protein [Lacticaseibacillus zhaodongensis]|uniref:EAL domain-containing protein n=1 Tax=Lacticaseibacillus zhaodongensis TaxID=2668065 RepID=UPI0018AF6FEF|nr:EAL domain-containing protein [Lacticaseibacillus zhaodongensis]
MSEPLYRYFAQQQFNVYTNTIIGFELLLKYYQDGYWQTPRDFNQLSAQTVAGQLLLTTEKLATKTNTVSVNLTLDQLNSPEMRQALKTVQLRLRPTRVIVELIESGGGDDVTLPGLIQMIKGFTDLGINFSLDDVGTGQNTWPQVEPLLDYVQEMKYALQNRHETLADATTREHVTFWRQLATRHHMNFVLEGIETQEDVDWADKMELDVRQGYFYSKPELIRVTADDPDVALH